MSREPSELWAGLPGLARRVPTGCLIGSEWRPAEGGARFVVENPASGASLCEVANSSVVDGLFAVAAAAQALPAWAATAPRERSEILRRAFALLIERAEEIARLMVLENGKALADARAEVTYAAEFLRWYSEEAVRVPGEIATAPSGTNRILVLRQPIGVAVLVTPWNFPAAMLTRKIGPALAAGCTVVCKPASDTPLTVLALAELLLEAGTPPGVVNVVPSRSSSAVVGAMLVDARVRKLSFTGSTEVGRGLLAAAAEQVLSCSMELGGNAPFIVFSDADLDAAVAGAMVAKMRNAGEACTAANRFYVQEPVVEEFGRRLVAAMRQLRVGPGLEEGVQVGPLINAAALTKVAELVDQAVGAGAKVLTGGTAPARPGYFYEPTVLGDVAPDASVVREEIFGPVAPLVTFSSEDEVVSLANDSIHGLTAYLYTADLGRGLRVCEALESGMVGLNRGLVSDPAAPFGGVKQSGLGREGGREGMLEYLEQKYIAVSWAGGPDSR